MVRRGEEAEREKRMRRAVQDSLSSRLPAYEDDLEDEDEKLAMGRTTAVRGVTPKDLDEEDSELDEFNALAPEEKLRRVVEFLRQEFHYCFWCKFTYPDATMDGCPGSTEEEHDE